MTKITADYEADRTELGERVAEALHTPMEQTPESVTVALEYARAYQQMAEFLAANLDLAERATVYPARYTHIVPPYNADPIAFIVDAAKRGREFGAPVEEWSDGRHGGVKISFGPLYVKVYDEAHRVCQRIVVGMVEQVEYALVVDLDGTPRKQVEVKA